MRSSSVLRAITYIVLLIIIVVVFLIVYFLKKREKYGYALGAPGACGPSYTSTCGSSGNMAGMTYSGATNLSMGQAGTDPFANSVAQFVPSI